MPVPRPNYHIYWIYHDTRNGSSGDYLSNAVCYVCVGGVATEASVTGAWVSGVGIEGRVERDRGNSTWHL